MKFKSTLLMTGAAGALLLSACSNYNVRTVETTYSPVERPAMSMSSVVVYRPANDIYGLSVSDYISVDGAPLTSLSRKAYTVFCVKPGRHTIGSHLEDTLIYSDRNIKSQTLDFEGGKSYFFRVNADQSHAPLTQIDRLNAETQLSGVGWTNASNVAAPSVVTCEGYKEPPVIKPENKKVTLGADALFQFNKSTLKDLLPAGRAQLDKLIADSKGLKIDAAIVTGYTDQIGTDAYNDRLSRARAETVRSYLQAKGFPAAAMSIDGKGKRDPVVPMSQCEGKPQAEMIACLQPNRRVVIDLQGVK